MTKFLRLFAFLFVLGLATSCTRKGTEGPQGTGEGIGGGDLLAEELKDIRENILLKAALKLEAGQGEGLCDFSQCSTSEDPVCQKIRPLEVAERATCQAFILSNLKGLIERLQSPYVTFVASSDRLFVAGAEVTMQTGLVENGPISASVLRIKEEGLTHEQIAAILGHEFFHKVKDSVTQTFLSDGDTVGPLSGSQLLTFAGYAMVFAARDTVASGAALAALKISDGPAYDFKTRPKNAPVTKTITITNEGQRAANAFAVHLPSQFPSALGTCAGLTSLDVSASCTIEITLPTSVEGDFTDSVSLTYYDGQKNRSSLLPLYGHVRTPALYVSSSVAGSDSRVKALHAQTGASLARGVNNLTPFPGYDGELHFASGDINTDGKLDLAVSTSQYLGAPTSVRTFDIQSGASVGGVAGEFIPYSSFGGGAFAAFADLDGDGKDDIVTGADALGGPHVKALSGITGLFMGGFFAFDREYTGGVRVAAGDLDGDGKAEVITTSGPGIVLTVKAFTHKGELLWTVQPFSTFGGGAYLATGDVNGDGKSDMIVAAGGNGGPHVRVYSGADRSLLMDFFAYASDYAGGVSVAAGDIDGDGKCDVITAPRSGGNFPIRVLSGADGHELYSIAPLNPAATSVFVGFSY